MNKQKTHKGAQKRFKVSATGKLRYNKSFAGHLMSGKSGRRRQRLRRVVTLTGQAAKNNIARLGLG
jgi:large subunit ribosomal protein L35